MSLGWAPLLVAAPAPPFSLTLRTGFNETLKIPGLLRAAVGDEKVARVRAFPPDVLLVTARQSGKTLVRAWGTAGESTISISVVGGEVIDSIRDDGDSSVIRISIEFLEVTSSAGEALGLRWPDSIHFSGAGGASGDLASSAINYSASVTSSKGALNLLVKKGLAKILARPELFVRTGEEASFHSGGEFPVAYSNASSGTFHRRVDWKPYGLSLKVKPRSHDHLHIQSDVALELSELNHGAGLEGIPSLTRRKLETKTSSLDGETVILSGLLRQVEGKTKEGIPILSDLPLLGDLFGQRGTHTEDTELFMTVTYSFTTVERNRQKQRDWDSRLRAKKVDL